MFSKINSLGLFGLNTFHVDVEIDISRGAPSFDIVGLPDLAVRESRERIRAALRSCNIAIPVAKIMVNLAPANTRKSGSVHDLAILVAIICAINYAGQTITTGALKECSFIGEVSLNGDVRPVNGVLPMVLLAKKNNIASVFVPFENAYEASVVNGIGVYGVKNIKELIDHLTGNRLIEKASEYKITAPDYAYDLNFSSVKGQSAAKSALEIAAAGGHNALLIGPPGSGKSMLAKRMPSILPEMTFEESIETTNIYSISDMLDKNTPLIITRPFRSPHHTITPAGLVGGGNVIRPGEISLAHNGLLFLDELPEFDRRTLEVLRQPLEDKQITISRAAGNLVYPASFMLIAAMNPCPCGFYGHPAKKCICSSVKVSSYLSKISGPLLDRFDLHIEVPPVEYENISSKQEAESSESIRVRVQSARKIQTERFKGTSIACNSQITPDKLQHFCPMDDSANMLIKDAFEKLGLSARAYDRILKVSRTIADMEGSEVIKKLHVARAIQYRSLDRKYWRG